MKLFVLTSAHAFSRSTLQRSAIGIFFFLKIQQNCMRLNRTRKLLRK